MQRTYRLEIFLISLAAIVLEISMTRIFSFKLYYYFTYLILGIAMLGLGAGGVFVTLFARLREKDPTRLISQCCLAASLLIPIVYLLVARIQISVPLLTSDPGELAKLFLICVFLFAPFLVVGIILSTMFGNRPDDMNKLYFADLLGAALGCILAVPLFISITPPGAVLGTSLVMAVAGIVSARSSGRGLQVACFVVALVVGATIAIPGAIPGPLPDPIKTMSPQKLRSTETLYSSWSSVFRVDVTESGFDNYYLMHHDGNLGSALHRFNGDYDSLKRFDSNLRSKPFSVVGEQAKVLIIGVAGGHEVLASLYFNAREITGVELNPVTLSLLTEHFAEFTGNIAYDPRVTLINAEGRSFLEKTDEKFDLIWMVAPDSYAAMNAASSAAFVLSESYLYTVEMLTEALSHLSEGGVLCSQFGEFFLFSTPNRTPRFVATAREALARLGVEDFENHIMVSAGPAFVPGSTVLVSLTGFDDAARQRYVENAAKLDKTEMWHPLPPGSAFSNPITKIINLNDEDLAEWSDSYVYNVEPVTDNSPFFWHFVPFSSAISDRFHKAPTLPDFEVATGERVLLILLVLSIVLASIFILLPTVAIRDVWSQMPHKFEASLYFGALGLGFMFYEVCLIQRLTLFLGYPSYSLTVTLFSILISSGVGSLLSENYAKNRNRAFAWLLGALFLITLAIQFGYGPLIDVFRHASLSLRIVVAAIALAPVGLVLGAFLPTGIKTVAALSPFKKQYVAWAWAINGFFSVVASVLATILSMTFGFQMVFVLAFFIYVIGVVAFSRIPAPPVS
ncbi:MAG: hypothetical protein VCC04_00985 [Myxococcota bacterium]